MPQRQRHLAQSEIPDALALRQLLCGISRRQERISGSQITNKNKNVEANEHFGTDGEGIGGLIPKKENVMACSYLSPILFGIALAWTPSVIFLVWILFRDRKFHDKIREHNYEAPLPERSTQHFNLRRDL